MNAPDSNRVTITDLPNGLEVVILPFQKPILWLQGVVYLGFFGLFNYFLFFDNPKPTTDDRSGLHFMIGMLCLLTLALISTTYRIWWTIKGREVVTVAGGMITIEKVNSLEKKKSYDLNLATNFRSVEEVVRTGRNFSRIEGAAWQAAVMGTVKFDYDIVDVKQFGDWLSEAEGEYILQKLRDKKLIT